MRERQKVFDPYTGRVLRHGWGGNNTIREEMLKDQAIASVEKLTHPFKDEKFSITTVETHFFGAASYSIAEILSSKSRRF